MNAARIAALAVVLAAKAARWARSKRRTRVSAADLADLTNAAVDPHWERVKQTLGRASAGELGDRIPLDLSAIYDGLYEQCLDDFDSDGGPA